MGYVVHLNYTYSLENGDEEGEYGRRGTRGGNEGNADELSGLAGMTVGREEEFENYQMKKKKRVKPRLNG